MRAFSEGTPRLPGPASAATINVAGQKNDPKSLLVWYRSLILLKKTVPAIESGADILFDTDWGLHG